MSPTDVKTGPNGGDQEPLPAWLEVANYTEPPSFQYSRLKDYNPRSGQLKIREIWAPNDAMREIHGNMIRAIDKLDIDMPYATGGFKGSSPVKNLRPHVDNRYFAMFDLSSAYTSVDMERLSYILAALGLHDNPPTIQQHLEQYFQAPTSGLYTGGPASPLLFNLACQPLDEELGFMADWYGLTYTRYIDDLTFSSADSSGPIGHRKRAKIRAAVEHQGFVLNHKKARVEDLQQGRVVVTGLQLNRTGKWQLPTEYQRNVAADLKAMLEQLSHGKPLDEDQFSRLSGLHGAIISGLDKRRVIYPEAHTAMARNYERIRRLQKLLTR